MTSSRATESDRRGDQAPSRQCEGRAPTVKMPKGLKFLMLKPWHPSNKANQKKIWLAEQTDMDKRTSEARTPPRPGLRAAACALSDARTQAESAAEVQRNLDALEMQQALRGGESAASSKSHPLNFMCAAARARVREEYAPRACDLMRVRMGWLAGTRHRLG